MRSLIFKTNNIRDLFSINKNINNLNIKMNDNNEKERKKKIYELNSE